MKPLSSKALRDLSDEYAAALTPELLESITLFSPKTLQSFGIGYSEEYGRYTFPMMDGRLELTGFALWSPDSKPAVVPGSRPGLFIPQPYEVVDCPEINGHPQTLIVPQGPLDAMLVRDCGFMGVIGRSMGAVFVQSVVMLLSGKPRQEVVVCLPASAGEGYIEGITSAMGLIEAIWRMADVRLLKPPGAFREICTDFGTLAAYVVGATWMTEGRMAAARKRLKELTKGTIAV